MKHFNGKKVVIATMHKKENVIGKHFKEAFGVEVTVPTYFDTDKFGTFTRDIKRSGSQLDAARKKAEEVLKQEGVDIAIASEGTFSPHPYFPGVTDNHELVILVDKKNNLEVRGHAQSSVTNYNQRKVSTKEEVMSFAKEVGFPEHGIILRKSPSSRKIVKDIHTWEELEKVTTELLSGFFTRSIFLESDMRAHRNPTRMNVIEEATKDLVKNIKATCPKCEAIGFLKKDTLGNAVCEGCGQETAVPGTFVYACQKCNYEEVRKEVPFVPQSECQNCNP